MPNWCDCDLTVMGKTEDVQRLKEAVREGDEVLSASKIIPYPEDFEILDKANPMIGGEPVPLPEEAKRRLAEKGYDLNKDGFNQGGYEWCVKNWGTKWGFCHAELVEEHTAGGETFLAYRFYTAWSPPLPLIRKLGEMFPTLKLELRYFEAGMGFSGLFRMEGGQVTADEEGPYSGDRGG